MPLDVVIIGGSFAGLSTALYLGRAQRSVRIIDSAKPRNRFSHHAHGIFGHDGSDPADILAKARTQVLAYPTNRVVNGAAVRIERAARGFTTTDINRQPRKRHRCAPSSKAESKSKDLLFARFMAKIPISRPPSSRTVDSSNSMRSTSVPGITPTPTSPNNSAATMRRDPSASASS